MGKSLRFRLTSDPATLDWTMARSSDETYVIMNLMDGLVRESADLKPQPALAEKWDVSEDGRVYTFHLRPGVKWSDGRPLKASDFEEAWIRLLDPKTRSSYAGFLFDIENAEAFHQGKLRSRSQVGVRATGDLSLEVKLRRRVPYFLHLPSFWVTFPIRGDLIKKHGARWATPGKIATVGPYLLKDWKAGERLVMVSNPGYYAAASVPAGAPSRVEAVIEPDENKARDLFRSGQLDFLLNATTEDLLKVNSGSAGEGTRVERFPYLATYYLGFRVNSGPLRDAGIRKAFALALDRAAIPSALQGGQVSASSWLPPGIEGYGAADLKLEGTLYDAKGALTRAGYVEGARFPKIPLWVERFDGAQALADFIAKSLYDKLGIRVEPRIGPLSDFQKKVPAEEAAIFVAHWGADYPEASNFLDVFASGSGTNYTGWSNAEYDEKLAKARATADAGERYAAYEAAERLLVQREAVIVPLFYKRNTVLVSPRVKKLVISPLNYLFLTEIGLR